MRATVEQRPRSRGNPDAFLFVFDELETASGQRRWPDDPGVSNGNAILVEVGIAAIAKTVSVSITLIEISRLDTIVQRIDQRVVVAVWNDRCVKDA